MCVLITQFTFLWWIPILVKIRFDGSEIRALQSRHLAQLTLPQACLYDSWISKKKYEPKRHEINSTLRKLGTLKESSTV